MRLLPSSQRKRNSGYTIIELMVSIAIGLAILAAIGQLFVANKVTYNLQDDSSRLQESANAALDLLGYHIRQAGYVDISVDIARTNKLLDQSNSGWLRKSDPTKKQDMIKTIFGLPAGSVYTPAIQAVIGCDNGFGSTTSVAPPWTCGGVGSSAIIVAYQALPSVLDGIAVESPIKAHFDTLRGYDPATGAGGDCGGRDVNGMTANPQGALAINLFYVDTATNRLMCTGSGDPSHPRPVAEGIENMVLLYGISPASGGDTFAGQYVKASSVTDWTRVLAVRVCLQAVSSNPVASSVTSYTDCDGNVKPQSDRKLRRVYRSTFSLRNNVLTMP